jgi:hypothetical protein
MEACADYIQLFFVRLISGVGPNLSAEQLTLSISNVDALPSKKAGIDRPCAWSEEGQGSTESPQ